MIKVTTTSSLQDVQIEEYIETISVSIVIGMNIFKDFLTQFRDEWGGKSNSYSKSFEDINRQAIHELRKKAQKLNANYIIGLTIENDEIAAQGKSMLMVTAMGTAVKVSKNNGEQNGDPNSIGLEAFKSLELKYNLIRQAENNELLLNDKTWKLIIDNEISELSSFILTEYQTNSKSLDLKENVLHFFDTILEEKAIKELYDFINSNLSKNVDPIIDIIRELNFSDYKQNILLLESEEDELVNSGVILSGMLKRSYLKPDIHLIKMIITLLDDKFPIKAELYETFSTVFQKNLVYWKCECGKENKEREKSCKKCGLDRYGNKISEMPVSEIIDSLRNRLEILEQYFNE